MMKLGLSIVGLIVMFFVEGCDMIVQPGEMPYEKKLVISALLQSGKAVDQVLIGKTMPPNQDYAPSQAAVTSASGFITVDGTVHALTFSGYYQPYGTETGFAVYGAQGLIPEPGKTYSITVEAEGLRATSTTLVPPTAHIDTLVVETVFRDGTTQYYLGIMLKQQAGVTYAMGYSFSPSAAQDIVEPPRELIQLAVGSVIVYEMPVGRWRPDLADSLTSVTVSYDEQYYDYYRTHQNGTGSGDLLGQSLAPVQWNVHGDGIGLFIGASVTRQRVASQ